MPSQRYAPPGPAPARPQWRSHAGTWAAIVVALVVAAQWWVTPDAFADYSKSQSVDPERALQQDETLVVPLGADQYRDDVVVWRAVPRVNADGPAFVEVLACSGNPVIGVGRLDAMCADARSADGVRPRGGDGRSELMLVIHSLGATRVEVSGVDITYRAGVQLGHQHTGERFIVDYEGRG